MSGVLRIVLLVLAPVLALYLVWRIRSVIQLLVISLFFAFALFPVVDALAVKTRAPRAIVIPVVYMALALLVGLIRYVVVPSVVREVHTLSHDAPHYAAQLRHNSTFRHYDDRYHITAKLLRDTHRLPDLLAKAAGPLTDVTRSGQLRDGADHGPGGHVLVRLARPRVRRVGAVIDRRAPGALPAGHHRNQRRGGRYTLGNIIISVLASLATWIVLSILGVPYALALGLVVGFFDFIPLVGAKLGAIVVALATVP